LAIFPFFADSFIILSSFEAKNSKMQDRMTEETTQPLTLDHNGQIPVEMKPVLDDKVEITLNLGRIQSAHLLTRDGHLRGGGLDVRVDGKVPNSNLTYDKYGKILHLSADVGAGAGALELTLYGQPLIRWLRAADGQWHHDVSSQHHRLIASELRVLGTSEVRPPNIPVGRAMWDGFDAAKHAPITDLHTHSSSQITAHEFMELGLKHQIDYPVELLEKLGITLSDDERAHVRGDGVSRKFNPTQAEGLQCEQGGSTKCDVIPLSQLSKTHRDIIESRMHVPQDAVLCFSDFDREMYRFLNPFSKNEALTRDVIYKIGESYAAHGIRYAELSTSAMLATGKDGKAEWFREMVAAVDEVEKKHGVRLRFLVGIARDKPPHEVLTTLEQIKYAARHPYIAGVDILGYENNKAKQLSWALEHIADWARASEGSDLKPGDGWNFKRDFVIRTHAGETAKNDGNVAESVRIAERTGVKVRVAHAVHEQENEAIDARVAALSARDHAAIGFEFCPISNIAYNNILRLDGVPFERWTKACKNWFLGSDGVGAVQSTPVQLALAGLAGGLTIRDLEHLRQNEERYIANEHVRNAEKTKAFMKRYGGASVVQANEVFFEGFEKHLAYVNSLTDTRRIDTLQPKLPREYDDKVPILIAGAGGESWGLMDLKSQADAAHAMRLLVAALDPKQMHFVCGRTKDEGITKVLDDAIRLHNDAHPEDRFLLLALNTAESSEVASSIHWIVPQGGDTSKVSANITQFMANHPMQGVSVFIGGRNFTQDMIAQTMRKRDAKFLIMENAQGATKEYADKLKDERKFSDAFTLVQRMAEALQDMYPEKNIFRAGVNPFDRASLQALEKKMIEEAAPRTTVMAGERRLLPPAEEVEGPAAGK
jgi:adenosine deaminase